MSAEKSMAQVSEPMDGIPVISTTVDTPICAEKALSLVPSTVMVVLEGLAITGLLIVMLPDVFEGCDLHSANFAAARSD
jgi:hypothetical protein